MTAAAPLRRLLGENKYGFRKEKVVNVPTLTIGLVVQESRLHHVMRGISVIGKTESNHGVATKERGRPHILRGLCRGRGPGLHQNVTTKITKSPGNTRMKEVESAAVEAGGRIPEATLLIEVGEFVSLCS